MLTPSAQSALEDLNGLVRLDGGELVLRSFEGSVVDLELDLTNSSCPECVLPKELLVEMLAARLKEADPGIAEVRLSDPREAGGVAAGH